MQIPAEHKNVDIRHVYSLIDNIIMATSLIFDRSTERDTFTCLT